MYAVVLKPGIITIMYILFLSIYYKYKIKFLSKNILNTNWYISSYHKIVETSDYVPHGHDNYKLTSKDDILKIFTNTN